MTSTDFISQKGHRKKGVMPSPEGYNPNLPKNINDRNEAGEINEMVDKGLLARQAAGEFDYANEMETTEALLSKPPKVSERLRKQVMDKFPPKSFRPENIAGRIIHGTYLHAIKPIWLGDGSVRTRFDGRSQKEEIGGMLYHDSSEGVYEVVGDLTRLDNQGFYIRVKDEDSGEVVRTPAFQGMPFPIFLIFEKSESSEEYLDEIDWFDPSMNEPAYYEGILDDEDQITGETNISAIVLTTDPRNLVEPKSYTTQDKQYYVSGTPTPKKKGLHLTLSQEANYIAHCMVAGVDKSKIVPVYDWDGNLLWPTEDDVIKRDEESE